jgi:hypothetical protein
MDHPEIIRNFKFVDMRWRLRAVSQSYLRRPLEATRDRLAVHESSPASRSRTVLKKGLS